MNTTLRNELLRHLDDGTTGCLSVVARGGLLRLYVMNGEILASDSPEDDSQILRRTVVSGLTDRDTAAALMRRAQETPIAELLFETLSETTAQRLVFERFQENVCNWLAADSLAEFQALPTIFHPNFQIGHDSRALLGQLEVVLARTRPLRSGNGFQLRVYRGQYAPVHPDAKVILELVGVGRTIAQVLRISPFEEMHTLDRIALMLEDEELSRVDEPKSAPKAAPEPPQPEPVPVAVEDAPELDGGGDDFIEALEAADSAPAAVDALAGARRLAQQAEEDEEDEGDDDEADDDDASEPPAAQPETPTKVVQQVDLSTTPDLSSLRLHNGNPETMAADMSDQDLALFEDNDASGRGTNQFLYTGENVADDRIDLNQREEAVAVEAVEDRSGSSVQVRYSGPALTNADARRKIEIANDILKYMSAALDDKNGIGSGNATVQLLLEGSPAEFLVVFHDVRVNSEGAANADAILSNLRRRPPTEHRRLLNRALSDLIDRAMNAAAEELDDDMLDAVLERCAGFQSRLGL